MNYNRRAIVQSKVTTYNSYNEPIDAWSDGSTLWFGIITTGGGEFYAAQKLNSTTQVVFKTRYNNHIKVTDRIKYDNRIFEVLSVNDVDEAHIELQIAAKEVI